MKTKLLLLIIAAFAASTVSAAPDKGVCRIRDGAIVRDGKPVALRGVNAMHVFGGDGSDLKLWAGIDIVREFVGNLRDAPLTPAETFHDVTNKNYLHSLVDVVAADTGQGEVVILCPFGWDGTSATVFCGKKPSETPWYGDYKKRMREWAAAFRGQPNVWIELWNEPFGGKASQEFDAPWRTDMTDMIDNLRSAGWNGVIVVPGTSWGQDETTILRQGADLARRRGELIFDVHAYEQWLKGEPATINTRLAAMKATRLPFLFGEVGPHNNQNLMDVKPFLSAAGAARIPVIAWLYDRSDREANSLRNKSGDPNDANNFGWGSAYKAFLAEPR